jgi:hypothetical protein
MYLGKILALAHVVLAGLGGLLVSAGVDSAVVLPGERPSHLNEASYSIQAGLEGEVYPAFANYASLQKQNERRFGVVSITVANPTPALLRRRITVQVAGWSDSEVRDIQLEAGGSQTLVFAPSFLPRFYQNREITAATADVSVTDASGVKVFETTVPLRLRSAEDIFWGKNFEYAPFIASWVTPHDPLVEGMLAKAKEYTADHRLPGYEDWKDASNQERETYQEAKAIYTTMQQAGLSYVKSSMTLGGHQEFSERVRMPKASLRNSSANCIDAAVMYASLFENLGMDPEVIIVPGHAYVGVRVAQGSSRFLLIDAALTGRSTFEAAVASAHAGMLRHKSSSITQIVISQARFAGIYPMP